MTSRQLRPIAHPRTARRAIAVAMSTILSVLIGLVWQPTPAAEAASTPLTGCAFRDSPAGSSTARIAPQLCWIDFTGVDFSKPGTYQRQMGAYTLSFTLTTTGTQKADTLSVTADQPDPGAMFGNSVFTKVSGSNRPIIRQAGGGTLDNGVALQRFTFTNISLVSTATGKPVQDFNLTVAEAERTKITEFISIDNGDTDYSNGPLIRKVTDDKHPTACNSLFGPGQEGLPLGSTVQRDFVCKGVATDGMFLARLVNPTRVTVSTFSYSDQAFAMAISLASAGGTVTADTTIQGTPDRPMEKLLTGAETNFDLQVWSDATGSAAPFVVVPGPAGTGAIGAQDGSREPYPRRLSATGNQASLPVTMYQGTDRLYFRSAGSKVPGGDQAAVFRRYTPLWTCAEGTGSPFVVTTAGATGPAGNTQYTVTNDTAAGTSTVTVTNPDSVPTSCNVYWQGNYKQATVNVSKLVSGTAAGFPEVQLRTYDLNYTCTLDGYAAAYPVASFPAAALTGTVSLTAGGKQDLLTLPQRASCTFTESFPGGAAPALPGKRLTLVWGPAPTATGTWDSIDKVDKLPSKNVTLGSSNPLTATNTYDYRGGTVDIAKTIQGEPVAELANTTKNYDFQWSCDGTDRSGQFTLTVTYAADGTASGTAPRLTDVPVERSCWLRPLTGLSTAQSDYISFDGRSVNVTGTVASPGQAPLQGGAYGFRLNDYADTDGAVVTTLGSNGKGISSASIQIVATYSYKKADLKILKQLSGTGAQRARAELASSTFPVSYRCTYGLGGRYTVAGSVAATLDAAAPVTVPGVPVGAACQVWEDVANAPQGTNVQLVAGSTTVQGTDANDTTTVLGNDAALTTPVQVMHNATDDAHNRVIVTNEYVARVGTVALAKAVDKGGLTVALPNDFQFTFSCGERTVRRAGGAVVSVPLSGTATVSGGQTQLLRAETGDAELNALVNDQNGNLGVPFTNQCHATELPVTGLPTGVLLGNDAAAQSATVGSVSGTTIQVTNTFSAAGQGLTINQAVAGVPFLAQPVTYRLSCENVVLAAQYQTFSLGGSGASSIAIPASAVPEGTRCTLTEGPVDPGTRNPGGYPITRATRALMAADAGSGGVDTTLTAPGGVAAVSVGPFTVGATSVLNLTHTYGWVLADVRTEKQVAFDPATANLISADRKKVKQDRLFDISLHCVQPGGVVQDTAVEISATGTSLAGSSAFLDSVPVGSTCTATEGETTTAAGITVTREARSNGGPITPVATTFTVARDANLATFINTYARQLTRLQLNKIALLPANLDIAGEFGGLDNVPFHTHSFTLTCRDPFDETILGTFDMGTITGPGTTSIGGVPVGTECQVSGTEFGALPLAVGQLEIQLRPSSVDWVVDKNDGTTVTNQPVDDIATSQWFTTVGDDGDAELDNVVDLKNHYAVVMTDIDVRKDVVATDVGHGLLAQVDPTYELTYLCQGVGYRQWISSALTSPFAVAYDGLSEAVTDGSGTPPTSTRSSTSTIQVPAGAMCTLAEQDGSAVPDELALTVTTDTHRAPGGSDVNASALYTVTNSYQRRMVPVRLAMMQGGLLDGADPAGYTMTISCQDPGQTGVAQTFPLADVLGLESVADGGAPQRGPVVQLPVGSRCDLSLDGSPALAARNVLEVTQGARTPFVEFGVWDGQGKALDANPDVRPVDFAVYDDTTVLPAMKTYRFSVDLAADIRTPDGALVAMTIGAEAMHPRDTVTVTLTKTVAGDSPADAFLFSASCLPNDEPMWIPTGYPVITEGIPIGTVCTVQELAQGVWDESKDTATEISVTEPVLSVASTGDFLPSRGVINQQAVPATGTDPAQVGVHNVTLEVQPVDSPTNLATDGAPWSVTLLNSFAGLDIEKTIAAPALAARGDGVPTAVLPQDATTMEVTYRIRNTGAMPVSGLTLTDPAMSGRTLTRDGQTIVVDSEARAAAVGTIPADFCGLPAELAVGAEVDCTFTASLLEPIGRVERVSGGPATVAGTTDDGSAIDVADSDAYAALRPVPGILPQTGMQTLVWVLGIGIVVVLVGLWRRRRSDDSDDSDDAGQ